MKMSVTTWLPSSGPRMFIWKLNLTVVFVFELQLYFQITRPAKGDEEFQQEIDFEMSWM